MIICHIKELLMIYIYDFLRFPTPEDKIRVSWVGWLVAIPPGPSVLGPTSLRLNYLPTLTAETQFDSKEKENKSGRNEEKGVS